MSEEKERYNPFEKEKYWQDFWEQERIYEFNPEQQGSIFTVDTPPPTISGALHLGHIFSYIQAEVVARFKRMEGSNIRYPIGFDNNGLPTERLVEKELGVRGQDMELKKFVEACLNTTEKYKKIYENLWRSVGLSVDWRLGYSTIAPEVQKISQSVFKEFYEKGFIYKKNAPALYCTECRTSFAQAEKEDSEKESIFYDLSFKFENGEDLIIATTRPELLPACTAVFVNPEDKKYKQLVGREIIILGNDGKMKDINELPGMNGKTVNVARKIIIEKLKEGGFVKKEEKIIHSVGVHERCGTPIEFLPTTQWFVKMLDMKEKLLEAGNNITWHPSYMKKRYEEWVSGLKWDWCISRERFYGIPIPVFSCESCGKVVIPDNKSFPIDPKIQNIDDNCPSCKTGKLIAEKSVLDTWFTSSLTPDINNNNQINGQLKDKLYPMSMRPQAHDIIRTWAVYSILMGLYRHNEVPWKDLMVSGHILAKQGEKISKKTGGGKYNPEELVATKSADAIRYAMCGVALGKDAYFEEQEVEKGKKLVTKIYNAGKLVLSNLKDFNPRVEIREEDLESFDKWIIQRSRETADGMSKALENYEFSQARRLFEDFFWSDFCDNYLEIIKGRLSISSEDKERVTEKLSAQYASYLSFLNILKMASPFIPHITEEMYHADVIKKGEGDNVRDVIESKNNQGYFYQKENIKSIHNMKWPAGSKHFEKEPLEGIESALLIISEARKIKTAKKIKLSAKVSMLKIKCPKNKQNLLEAFLKDISSLVRAEEAVIIDGDNIEVLIEEYSQTSSK
ncbi:MAG: class I tRNA ligase family protein [Candidatus Staskawiczbacteria bacterium]|nr:class I tRNA ligase family protein [Candidatus Staskawiczbacteria bacterium]